MIEVHVYFSSMLLNKKKYEKSQIFDFLSNQRHNRSEIGQKFRLVPIKITVDNSLGKKYLLSTFIFVTFRNQSSAFCDPVHTVFYIQFFKV